MKLLFVCHKIKNTTLDALVECHQVSLKTGPTLGPHSWLLVMELEVSYNEFQLITFIWGSGMSALVNPGHIYSWQQSTAGFKEFM